MCFCNQSKAARNEIQADLVCTMIWLGYLVKWDDIPVEGARDLAVGALIGQHPWLVILLQSNLCESHFLPATIKVSISSSFTSYTI